MFGKNLIALVIATSIITGCSSSSNDDPQPVTVDRVTVADSNGETNSLTLTVGEGDTLVADVEYSDGTAVENEAVVWASSDTNIVVISADGIYEAIGTGQATLEAKIGDTVVAELNVTVRTANNAPVANAGNDITTLVGETILIDGSGSTDPDGDQLLYQWDNGQTTASFSQLFDQAGTFTFKLTVSDTSDATSEDTVTVTVNEAPVTNMAPVAVISGETSIEVDQGVSVDFDGSMSTDEDGSIAAYEWSFGADTAQASYTFMMPENHTITLTVTDNEGLQDSTSVTVKVNAVDFANNFEKVFIAGTNNNFGNGEPFTELTNIAENQWQASIEFPAATEEEPARFKFTNVDSWVEGDWGDADQDGTLEQSSGIPDSDILLPSGGTYTITFDGSTPDAPTYTFVKTSDEVTPEEPEEPVEDASAFIIGSFNNWVEFTALEEESEGTWTTQVTFTEAPEFKFTLQPDWEGDNYSDSDADGILETGVEANITLETAGKYTIKLMLADEVYSYTATLDEEITPEEPVEDASAFIIGSFDNWDEFKALDVESEGTWTTQVTFTEAPEFKFTLQPDWEGDNYSDSDADGILETGVEANITLETAGKYTIKLMLVDEVYSYTATLDEEITPEEPVENASAFIIGSFDNWDEFKALDVESEGTWTTQVTFTEAPEFKFTLQPDWEGDNYSDSDADGILETGVEANIILETAGKYTIKLMLADEVYSYTATLDEEITPEEPAEEVSSDFANAGETEVTFTITAEQVESTEGQVVVIAGSFNNWDAEAEGWEAELVENTWTLVKSVEDVFVPGGSGYPEFKFVVVADEQKFWKPAIIDNNEFVFPDGLDFSSNYNNVVLPNGSTKETLDALALHAEKALSELDTDEQYTIANYRAVSSSAVAADTLFRGIHPFLTFGERAEVSVDRQAAAMSLVTNSGIAKIINLSDSAASLSEWAAEEGNDIPAEYQAYIDASGVLFVETYFDEVFYQSDSAAFAEKVSTIVAFIANNEGPYYVHGRQGKDRTGVIVALLSALAGASWDDIAADFEQSNEAKMSGYVTKELLAYSLTTALEVDLSTADLADAVATYLTLKGTSSVEDIDAAKANLSAQ